MSKKNGVHLSISAGRVICSSFLLEGDRVRLFRDLWQALLLLLHLLQQSLQLSLRQALQPFLQQKRQSRSDQFPFRSTKAARVLADVRIQKLQASNLHDLLLVVPELLRVGHVLVGDPEHVGGDPPHRHPEHHQQLHHVAGLQGVHAEQLRVTIFFFSVA